MLLLSRVRNQINAHNNQTMNRASMMFLLLMCGLKMYRPLSSSAKFDCIFKVHRTFGTNRTILRFPEAKQSISVLLLLNFFLNLVLMSLNLNIEAKKTFLRECCGKVLAVLMETFVHESNIEH